MHLTGLAQVDDRLTNLCNRRKYLTRGTFWRLVDSLLDTRLLLTTPPDTGTVPTREAYDGRSWTPTGPEKPAA